MTMMLAIAIAIAWHGSCNQIDGLPEKIWNLFFEVAKKHQHQMPIYWLSKMANFKLTMASEMSTVVACSGAYESPFHCYCQHHQFIPKVTDRFSPYSIFLSLALFGKQKSTTKLPHLHAAIQFESLEMETVYIYFVSKGGQKKK